MNSFRLPKGTNIQYVHLQVSNLGRSLAFYDDLLGLREVRRENSNVFLSAHGKFPPLFILTEKENAQPRPRRSTGLFHVAILYPHRRELAKAFKWLYQHQWPFQGFADHGVSEAIYLADPEGNGIELYADRPRDQWPYRDGELAMVTAELDLENLHAAIPKDHDVWSKIHPETKIGHIHLQVSNLTKAEEFYHEILGFDITQRTYPGALFVSAGKYHHHIGLNIWNSRGGVSPPLDALGLVRFGIEVPDQRTLETLQQRLESSGVEIEEKTHRSIFVRDFDGIGIEIVSQIN